MVFSTEVSTVDSDDHPLRLPFRHLTRRSRCVVAGPVTKNFRRLSSGFW